MGTMQYLVDFTNKTIIEMDKCHVGRVDFNQDSDEDSYQSTWFGLALKWINEHPKCTVELMTEHNIFFDEPHTDYKRFTLDYDHYKHTGELAFEGY